MRRARHKLVLSLLAALASCLSGCFGLNNNPSYFPYLLPFEDVIPTHSKPISPGYYANFDPHAIRLEVRPLEATNQVRTQHVLIATVYDEKGQPRRNRRVEWMLEGVGNIMEVDEAGITPGRGYKTGPKHGVSFTACFEHAFTRGNDNPADDFVIRPGQTWCVITSAVEGDTHITAYAPGIFNWEKSKVFVTCRWVDANWEFPPPAATRAGSEHVFTTKVFRHTDHQPLAKYRVRYKILDGPPAIFKPSGTNEYVSISDLDGNAHVTIAQLAPAFGVNRIGIEVIRPPDPTSPSGAGITIARGETSIEWLAPNVTLSHTGPPMVLLGQEVVFATTISNAGRIESKSMTVTSQIPEGVQYVRSQPPAFSDGKQLVWTLGTLPPGQAHQIQAVFKTLRPGPVTSCAALVTEEGQKDQKCVTTQVTTASLRVSLNAPATGVVGVPVTYQITVANPNATPLAAVVLRAQYDEGLAHETGARNLTLQLGDLPAQGSRNETLVLTPRQAGKFSTRVIAQSGEISDQAIHEINVQQAQMSLAIDGPRTRYKGRPADFTIRIGNASDVPMTNVVVRDKLPPELQFTSAGQGGQQVAGEVVWNLGTLNPREERALQLSTRALSLTKAAVQAVTATADPGLRKDAQASLEIFGLPALKTEFRDLEDPVQVGQKVRYELKITNQGDLPAKDIDIKATVPVEMKFAKATPVQPNVQGLTLTFPKIAILQPGEAQTLTIEVDTLKAGDVRFRVEVSSPITLESGPIIEEESTRIYDAGQGPPPAAPPKL
jgi:uncharacterized repeat protein (TIGR01451 family)